jgi:hypothetical protein
METCRLGKEGRLKFIGFFLSSIVCLRLFQHKGTENILFWASIGITEDPGINRRWDYIFIS